MRCVRVCQDSGSKGKCKFCFPFKINLKENYDDEENLRISYVRREKEDAYVVPYNLRILLLWEAHMNIQKISEIGWMAYVCKYITKGEKLFNVKLKEGTSQVEKYLKLRIIG